MKKVLVLFMSCLLFLSVFSSCKEETPAVRTGFYLYYRYTDRLSLYPVELTNAEIVDEIQKEDGARTLLDLWLSLSETQQTPNLVNPIPEGIDLKSCFMESQNLIFNFNSAYQSISLSDEVLLRSCLVKTFTQLKGVSTVEIRVEEQPLILQNGTVVGPQKSSDFVDVFGSGLTAYTDASVTLYFMDESGRALVPVHRNIAYSNAVSLEQYVVSLLVRGPLSGENGYALLPSSIKIISVMSKDGVCYVNFGTDINSLSGSSALPEVIIYGIVNSLTELGGITSVQFAVNGDRDIIFMETLDLSGPLYRNLDYILTEEATEEGENLQTGE